MGSRLTEAVGEDLMNESHYAAHSAVCVVGVCPAKSHHSVELAQSFRTHAFRGSEALADLQLDNRDRRYRRDLLAHA